MSWWQGDLPTRIGLPGWTQSLAAPSDDQHAGLIMKASPFHDPGPKPTRYVVFGPGSWETGLAGPEATTTRHSRNPRTTTAATRRQSDRLVRCGYFLGIRRSTVAF